MPADDVTPFRRPPKRPAAPQQQGGWGLKTHRGKVVLGHVLTIAAFVSNFFLTGVPWSFLALGIAIAAVVVVYTSRGEATPWANTHHEHALRTLIIGYAINVVAGLLVVVSGTLVLITFYVTLAVTVWAVVRAVIALVLGVMRKPVPNPRGWLI